jgi:hypothetical protein
MNTKLYAACLCLSVFAVCLNLSAVAGTPRPSVLKQDLPQKVQLAQAKKLAAQIKPGTSRAAIEKLYPYQDGGLSSYELSRYYLGNGIMVDVPFDQQGGEGHKLNRVNGPLRVYLSPPHFN